MTNIRERAPFLSTKGVPTGGPKGGLVDRYTVVNPPGLDQEAGFLVVFFSYERSFSGYGEKVRKARVSRALDRPIEICALERRHGAMRCRKTRRRPQVSFSSFLFLQMQEWKDGQKMTKE